MQVLVPGHRYVAANFEHREEGQVIQFIEKVPVLKAYELGLISKAEAVLREDYSLFVVSDGTTNEELLEILIDRLSFLNGKFPCRENSCAITHLEEALMWLEKRTKDREKRAVEGKQLA